ncbi:Regulator of RNase E activity RraA [Variovorax sp. YR750]|uniref:RraA family protein n=1 Tax=Variovorax sp. YR750 TaxID=1884384 RepID=UPI0008BFC385|nr:diguanylate cyclase [Variovorax sp. YR750]SEL33720.1 Regulator of RNase E activity RraA [Variovorax sp. YR750]
MTADLHRLSRLAALDTNTVSDALDFLNLPGATVGLRPLWDCPRIVGRASTIQLAPKQVDGELTVHPITSVIAQSQGDDRILVIAGGIEGISCWGDIVANAARMKHIRGSVLDGYSRDIAGSEEIGYPVYGRGVTMVSARNRLVQTSVGEPVVVAGVKVAQDDFVIADRCGSVFIAAAHIDDVLDIAERTASKQAGMVSRIRAGQSVAEAMHDRNFAAVMDERAAELPSR